MEQTDKERIKAQAKNHINVGDGYNELWETGWIAGATSEHETQVIPLRERLEKVEKALKEARDVLVMASLIDKSSTCMDAVNEIDQLLTKEG